MYNIAPFMKMWGIIIIISMIVTVVIFFILVKVFWFLGENSIKEAIKDALKEHEKSKETH